MFWSVMIPTFCPEEHFLRQTLLSILQQDPGVEQMQIEVVDDHSPNVAVEEMVRSIAGSRVTFHQNQKNLGLAGCWNSCIERAQGRWVHILHQDDYVLPGFYKTTGDMAKQYPTAALVATRSLIVDEHNIISGLTPRYPPLEKLTRAVDVFMRVNPFQCPGVIVQKVFYETSGKFRNDLLYTLDYEMWARAFNEQGGVLLPDALACYRQSTGNTTARLYRSAEAFYDAMRVIQIFEKKYPQYDSKYSYRSLYAMVFHYTRQFSKEGDREAEEANRKFWVKNVPLTEQLRVWLSWLLGNFFRRIGEWLTIK